MLGDPTVFGNFPPPESAVDAVVDSLRAGKKNGYAKSVGYDESRQALAEFYSLPHSKLEADDVIIASGCSGALDLAIGALASAGQNILMPAPGFSLYKTLASSKGVETKSYRCLPEKSWEIDLEHMESLIDANTCAIVVTNPSNPCGSNFSLAHVAEIVAVAERCKVPIIADEIYADMVYSGADFTSISAIESNVPVLACGGLAKRWLVPGWRVGWVLVRDKNGVLAKEVKPALVNLSQLILGACTPVQAAIPAILKDTSETFYATNQKNLKASAELLCTALSKVPGLNPVMPEAAMYMMVGVDVDQMKDISDDSEFCRKLLHEQSVFCLPGAVFDYPNYFRIVITSPVAKLEAAMERITAFCKDHHV
jgi:tyrosine aminotransferase